MTAPYIVRPTGPGAADVVDRATGERVGRVNGGDGVWWGQRADGTAALPIYGRGGQFGTRADAARAVWQARGGGAG